MSQLSYHDAWSFLDQLQFFKIKLGLDPMREFLASLNNPQDKIPFIHIGGTNGKGSVGTTLLSIFNESGYKVGFYTSPHLSSVRERFRIGDHYISENDFAAESQKIIKILNGRQITYSEFTTTLALLWFARKNVDLAIMEVGLGGRLDATNVIAPLVSVITNVSMDHEQYLGETIEEIASEKAGIIKPGIPVVTGERSTSPRGVIKAKAKKQKSPLYRSGDNFTGSISPSDTSCWDYQGLTSRLTDLPLSMKGEYQVDNASLALAALEVISPRFPVQEKHIRSGLLKTTWPGRLEELWRDQQGNIFKQAQPKSISTTHFLLDGAHNPAGAGALKKSLHHDFKYTHLILIWASMADKDTNGTLLTIAPLADTIIFTQPEAERSAAPKTLFDLLPKKLQDKAECESDVNKTLELAIQKSVPGSMICVAGSLYLIGRIRQILCGELV